MFEDSLMESQNRLSSPNQRWLTLASMAFQCTLAAGIIALPLLHPEVLPFHSTAPSISLPLKPVPPPVPHIDAKTASAAPSAEPSASVPATHTFNFKQLVPIGDLSKESPQVNMTMGSMTGPNDIPGGVGIASSTGTRVAVAPAPSRVRVSGGVSNGLLLAPIRPVYPQMAITTRTEGVVVVEAIISRAGRIESAHATNGPELLRNAALEAIRNARYSPYLLNGQPTEVETTITVHFKLAS